MQYNIMQYFLIELVQSRKKAKKCNVFRLNVKMNDQDENKRRRKL